MKLLKRNSSLFPKKFTKHWDSYPEKKYYPLSDDEESCPWNLSPKTIDDFVLACDQRNEWRKNNVEDPRYSWWSCILTHDLMEDIARTLKEIKDVKRNS